MSLLFDPQTPCRLRCNPSFQIRTNPLKCSGSSSITLLHHPPPSPIHAHTSSHHPHVFPDYHKWAFDPPEPAPPERGQPLSPSHSNKPPFLSPQKYKNQFLKPVDNAAIWQQEVRLLLALRCIERPPLSL